MEIESLKKDMSPTVEVKSTKERKQIYREFKERGKTKREEEETQCTEEWQLWITTGRWKQVETVDGGRKPEEI